jgi:hypothetical protein
MMTTPKHAFDHHTYAIGLKEAESGVNEAVALGRWTAQQGRSRT